ncbi:MAG TPA: hypothetical protein VHX52_11605 [Steroidobacteraceae bacterium]|jgi:hypothetical protein|nr:hypothetical protein [Steroidobacteraceae bacterium]
MSYRAKLRATILLGAGVILAGCSIPLQQTSPGAPPQSSAATNGSSTDTQSQCADLRTQIKTSQNALRQAPTTSINEDIVAAAQGKADKQLDDLRAQYDALGCPDAQLPPLHGQFAPLPPAPGGPQR